MFFQSEGWGRTVYIKKGPSPQAKKHRTLQEAPRKQPALSREYHRIVRSGYYKKNPKDAKKWKIKIDVSSRQDNQEWTVAGYDTYDIDILSELAWQKVNIFQVRSCVSYFHKKNWSFGLSLAYGQINSGINRDSDYAGNSRTEEWSRSLAHTSGYTLDIDASANLDIYFKRAPALVLTPNFGFAFYRQAHRMKNGVVTRGGIFDGLLATVGAMNGLNSTYVSDWYAPYIGIDASFNRFPFKVTVGVRTHFAKNVGEGYWNLRDLSFSNNSAGFGFSGHMNLAYSITKDLSVELDGSYKNFFTSAGINEHPDGAVIFNGSNWDSREVSLGVSYRF